MLHFQKSNALFGTLLLAMQRLEAVGLLPLAHQAMLEEMLEGWTRCDELDLDMSPDSETSTFSRNDSDADDSWDQLTDLPDHYEARPNSSDSESEEGEDDGDEGEAEGGDTEGEAGDGQGDADEAGDSSSPGKSGGEDEIANLPLQVGSNIDTEDEGLPMVQVAAGANEHTA